MQGLINSPVQAPVLGIGHTDFLSVKSLIGNIRVGSPVQVKHRIVVHRQISLFFPLSRNLFSGCFLRIVKLNCYV